MQDTTLVPVKRKMMAMCCKTMPMCVLPVGQGGEEKAEVCKTSEPAQPTEDLLQVIPLLGK